MNQFVFANNVQTTLAAAITTSTQTVIQVTSSANIPAIPSGYVWAVTLNDAATQTIFEIVYVTSVSGANLTVLRGQESTTARTWGVNDLVYACATAGTLQSFLSAAAPGNAVELSPVSMQSGFINISGAITAGGAGTFSGGIAIGGALTGATSGSFSGDVTALDLIASKAYANTAISSLPLRFSGSSTTVGVGPSSGLTTQGITATVLAIGAVSSGKFIALDTNGNLAASNNLYGVSGIFSSQVTAPQVLQNGAQVLNTISSSTLTVTKVGSNVDIEVPSSGVGRSLVAFGSGTGGSITVPNDGGTYVVEAEWRLKQSTGSNNGTYSISGGAGLTGVLSSGSYTNTFDSTNSLSVLLYAGECVGSGQTISFSFNASVPIGTSPWTIRATRIA